MSEILSETIEEIIKTKRKVIGIECDICGKIIPVSKGNESTYFKVTTGHNDWGNDSCESIKDQDICQNCIPKFVNEYLENSGGTTRYINIYAHYAMSCSRWE